MRKASRGDAVHASGRLACRHVPSGRLRDAAGTAQETDEQNNCSFNKLPGQAVIVMPLIPTEKSPE